jgi:hypothetical protein
MNSTCVLVAFQKQNSKSCTLVGGVHPLMNNLVLIAYLLGVVIDTPKRGRLKGQTRFPGFWCMITIPLVD